MVSLRFRTGSDETGLLSLPWQEPLSEWPDELCVRLPAGTHRHVVRFLHVGSHYVALKELPQRLAERELDILGRLREEGLPAVTLIGIATGRTDRDGEPLEAVLMTRHLRYSLPYRALFTDVQHEGLRDRLVDALAVLLVRLHMAGFYWGDCSLNNALFRRDAGALRAYVVDTETSEFHPTLSDGQRRHDLDIAAENTLGGLLDLEAEGLLDTSVDPADIAVRLVERYESLWAELTKAEEMPSSDLGRIHARLKRLNELGFDTEEYELHASDGIARFRPTVVEEGHHKRALMRLTGIEAHENQARRLLSAMRGYGAWLAQTEGEVLPEGVMAFRWMTERWQPALDMIPAELRSRLEDAELYHQILEHNWYLAEQADAEVPLAVAVQSYVDTVLSRRADERAVLPVGRLAGRSADG